MSEKNSTDKKKQASKKDNILHEITEQLSAAFTSLKESLGEKKFAKRIKKAAKLLSEDVKTKSSKKVISAKPSATKTKKAKKKTIAPKKGAKKTPPAKKAAPAK